MTADDPAPTGGGRARRPRARAQRAPARGRLDRCPRRRRRVRDRAARHSVRGRRGRPVARRAHGDQPRRQPTAISSTRWSSSTRIRPPARTDRRRGGGVLRRWPVPFASVLAAAQYFGGSPGSAAAWANGLERREDGWWPRFDFDVMTRTLSEALGRDYWAEWEQIRCPVLVLRAGTATSRGDRARR